MFKIVYKSDSSLIKRVLQDYQLDELKKNKVKIFDGTIMSNSIYLKAR